MTDIIFIVSTSNQDAAVAAEVKNEIIDFISRRV